MNNLGSLFLFTIFSVFISVLLWLSRRFKPLNRRFWYLQNKLDSLADESLWNSLISFYDGNYLAITVASFVESNDLRFGLEFTTTENVCSAFAVLGMVSAVAYPIVIYLLYREQTKNINPKTERFAKIMNCL